MTVRDATTGADPIYAWLDERRSEAWSRHFEATDAYKAALATGEPAERRMELAREFDRTRTAADTLQALCCQRTEEQMPARMPHR